MHRDLLERLRDRWHERVLRDPLVNDSIIGAILRTATGEQKASMVVYGSAGVIVDDSAEENDSLPFAKDGSGVVWTQVLEPGDAGSRPKPVCTTKQLHGALQSLVDKYARSYEEMEAMARVVQQWITRDGREQNRVENRIFLH